MMRLQNILNCVSSLIGISEVLKANSRSFTTFNVSTPS